MCTCDRKSGYVCPACRKPKDPPTLGMWMRKLVDLFCTSNRDEVITTNLINSIPLGMRSKVAMEFRVLASKLTQSTLRECKHPDPFQASERFQKCKACGAHRSQLITHDIDGYYPGQWGDWQF